MNDLRWISRGIFLVLFLAAVTLFMSTAVYFAGPKPFFALWEDSLMLTRYAHNFQRFGTVAWNPGGPATYGLTSPYYFLLVVLPVAKGITSLPLAIPVVASILSGLGFFASMLLVFRFLLPGPVVFRHLAMGVGALAIARNAGDISIHFLSGMDTFFALFYFAVYIAIAQWHALTPTYRSAAACGIWGGLAFGVRPDLLAWTMLVPVMWALLGANSRERRAGGVMLVSGGLVLLLQIGFAATYFHSPLPLPFYAKSLQLYPGLTGFRYIAFHNFTGFVLSYWLLILLIVTDAAVDVRGWWRETSPLTKGLAAGVVIHMGYFLLGVTQIMPTAQRFYYPSLPAILFLAGCATVRLLRRMPERLITGGERVPKVYRYAALAMAVLVLPPHVGELSIFGKFAHRDFASMDLEKEYRAYLAGYWFGLDRFSTLPPDLTMSTTEVGHVGAMNLGKQVIDMAGLNDPQFVHHRFAADEFFAHYHPDLIYMPHPGYRAMSDSLENDATFRRDYDWIPAEKLGGAEMGIAMSRTSRYYGTMKRIVAEVCAEQRTGPCTFTQP